MKRNSSYLDYVYKERQEVKNDIEKSLKKQGFSIEKMSITDEGYVVDATWVRSAGYDIPFDDVCERVDKLDFVNYRIVYITFFKTSVSLVVAPITEDAMNRFVWNYVICYFPFANEIEALFTAVGVLERAIEPLEAEVKATFEKYTSSLIN